MPEITKRWDWNVSLAYKYVESDAVLDALNDPDFHLGGTNARALAGLAPISASRRMPS